MVKKLEIMLTIPENEIVKQNTLPSADDKDINMYFIAKGEFNVYVQFQTNSKPTNVRQLQVGDHFGEISMIYKCKRTATVISNKYATLGYISKPDFKEIVFKFQDIVDLLNQRIYDYDDDLKLFKEYYIKEIPYFINVSVESLHHIIFTLQRETYEKDRKIL
mmetsp:Transcript_13955/g.16170  ORF Transcript_13955/g.16170 Transcript_13955/m.16170 type:complete len:162 (-) Transcript_13955:711-1196(-)